MLFQGKAKMRKGGVCRWWWWSWAQQETSRSKLEKRVSKARHAAACQTILSNARIFFQER